MIFLANSTHNRSLVTKKFLVGHFEWCLPLCDTGQKQAENGFFDFLEHKFNFLENRLRQKNDRAQFFSQSNGVVDNSPGGTIYPDRKAQSRNFGEKSGPRSAYDAIAPKRSVWHQFRLMVFKEDKIGNLEHPRNPNYLYWFRRYEFQKLNEKIRKLSENHFFLEK